MSEATRLSCKPEKSAGPAVVSGILALLTYAITLGGTFIYDDYDVFQNDARLHQPSQWGKYLTESYNGGVDNLYRPLVSLTYAIQWQIHHDTAWPYHAVNWLLHAAVSALVAELSRRLAGARVAYIAGILFAAHPIHVEAVANIVGRAELMCALGSIGAMVLLLRSPLTVGRSLAIFGCFLFALFSKEQGMLLPFLLTALHFCTRDPAVIVAPNERRAGITLILLCCWTLAGYIIFREAILKFEWDRTLLDWTINPIINSKGTDRARMPLVLLGRYVQLLVAPIHLSPDYGSNVIGSTVSLHDPYLWVGTAAMAICLVILLAARRKRWPIVGFLILSLGLTYGVISNAVTLIGTNFGERLVYLPSAFILILIAMAVSKLHRAAIPIAAMAALVLGTRSFAYARQWNDRLAFYETCVAQQPKSIRLRLLLTSELLARKDFTRAAESAAAERAILPEYSEVWIQSAQVAMESGRFDEAREFLDKAAQLKASAKILGWMQRLDELRAATRPASQ